MKSRQSYLFYQSINFVLLYVSYALVVYMRKSFAFIAPIISTDLSLRKSDLGLIASGQLFAYAISKFISGFAVDFYSGKVLLSFGLFFTSLSTILFSMTSSLPFLCLLWVLNGWFQGAAWPACAKVLIAWFPAHQFGTWWSILSTSMNVAGTGGPIISQIIVNNSTWQMSMVFPGIISILLTVIILMTLTNSPNDVGLINDKSLSNIDKNNSPKPSFSLYVLADLFRNPIFVCLIICDMLAFMVNTGLGDWGQLYLVQERSRSHQDGSTYTSSLQLGGVVGSIVAGFSSDFLCRQGSIASKRLKARIFVLLLCSSLMPTFLYYLLTNVSPSSSQIWVNFLGFLLGFGAYGSLCVFGVVAIECSPPHLHGSAQAITSLFCSVGGVMAGFPLSLVASAHGWCGAFWVLEAVSAITTFLLFMCYLFSDYGLPKVTSDRKEK